MKRIVSILIATGLTLVLSACGGGGGGGGGGGTGGDNGPVVVGTSPQNGAPSVSTGTQISITFSQAMEPVSTRDAFTISPFVNGTKNVDGTLLTFTPAQPLAISTNYIVTISAAARSSAANAPLTAYTFTFRTDGPSATGPARVTNLALLEGPAFGTLRLAFPAPAAGTGGAVAAYQIRYSGAAISDENFAQATPLPLLSGEPLPSPAAAGSTVTYSVNTSDAVLVDPGGALHFAMRAVDAGGGTAAVSNGVATTRPWHLTLRFDHAGQLATLMIGQQSTATDATDAGFDELMPPVLPLTLVAKTTLAGRPEALLRDIRGTFTATGQQTIFRIELEGGVASGNVDLDFPQFNSTTPFYTFKIALEGAPEADLTGVPISFALDGTGKRKFDLRVAN